MIDPKDQVIGTALYHARRHTEITAFKTIDSATREEHKALAALWLSIVDFLDKKEAVVAAPAVTPPAVKFDPINDYPDHGEQS